jgi:P27 family predicted phage terminase small subunit
MARARKPIEQHWLQGSTPAYSGREAQTFRVGRPKRPKNLPPVADEEWKRITRELAKRGTLTTVDSSALEVYVRLYAQWRAYCDEIEKHGAMVDEEVLDKNGEAHTRRIVNPASKLAIQLGNAVRAYQKEFSATPASRERTKPGVVPPKRNQFPHGSMGDIAAHPERYQEEAPAEVAQPTPPRVAAPEALDWPEATEEEEATVEASPIEEGKGILL